MDELQLELFMALRKNRVSQSVIEKYVMAGAQAKLFGYPVFECQEDGTDRPVTGAEMRNLCVTGDFNKSIVIDGENN